MNTLFSDNCMFLSGVAFYGRTFPEYLAFLGLAKNALPGRRILDCAAACSSFNRDATRLGAEVVSVDPCYKHPAAVLARRAQADITDVMRKARKAEDRFVFHYFADMDAVEAHRRRALALFLEDYPAGRAQGRYREAALPSLPFPDAAFDLALCGHFLFLYTYQLTDAFQQAAVLELCRVAREVRLYPLINIDGRRYAKLDALRRMLDRAGHRTQVVSLEYEFFRGADQALRILTTP